MVDRERCRRVYYFSSFSFHPGTSNESLSFILSRYETIVWQKKSLQKKSVRVKWVSTFYLRKRKGNLSGNACSLANRIVMRKAKFFAAVIINYARKTHLHIRLNYINLSDFQGRFLSYHWYEIPYYKRHVWL